MFTAAGRNNTASESEDFFSDDITEEKSVETPINTQNVIPEKTHGNLFKIDFDESNGEACPHHAIQNSLMQAVRSADDRLIA